MPACDPKGYRGRRLPATLRGIVGGACTDVKQTFHRVTRHEKKDLLLKILQDTNRNPQEKTLIFMKTKRQADFIALLVI